MLFERIESPGLAHYSYLLKDRGEAVVIDPRRDVDVYIEKTLVDGYNLTHILETHRNEDYVVGSLELAARTGALIWHADAQMAYEYGQPAEHGQTWQVGQFTLQAVHSPGHTPGGMSYILHDPAGNPWMAFTGDTLFAGDVGRVDLLGMDRAWELAGLLYDTIFHKLLPLGDHVLVCPAHGAGSACGAAISDRIWTSIGLERHLNPALQHTERDNFIRNTAKDLELPPYFRQVEMLNLKGTLGAYPVPVPVPLSPGQFESKTRESIVLDIGPETGFGCAHVPGSLFIWQSGLPAYAGWFLPYDKPILIVNEKDNPVEAARYLLRMGYDNLAGYLLGGMRAWHMAGYSSSSVRMVTAHELCSHLEAQKPAWILDVRSSGELEKNGRIKGAHHIHITQLPNKLDQVPRDVPVFIFCRSGLRSTTAASLLKREGWTDVAVMLGGFTAWKAISCPIE